MTEHAARGQYDSEGRWARGEFPPEWGEPPTFYDSLERRAWIARNADDAGSPHAALRRADGRLLDILRRAQLEARRNGPGEE